MPDSETEGRQGIARSTGAASMSARWEGKIMRQPLVFCAALGIALGVTAANAADKQIVGLITKTNTNPFFVKMKAGAEEAATANGIELRSFAGKIDGDNDGQVAAVENLIAAGAKSLLITPHDSRHIVT